MSDLIFPTYNDLYAARSIGRSLQTPSAHFVRVLRLFPVDGRLALLRDAYDFSKTLHGGSFSFSQFIAFSLFAWDPSHPDEHALNVTTPVSVRLEKLALDQKDMVDGVASCRDLRSLAVVLLSTSAGDRGVAESQLLKAISTWMRGRIGDAALGAAVAQCLLFNRKLIRSYHDEVDELVRFAASISEEEFETYEDEHRNDALPWTEWPPLPEIEFDRAHFNELAEEVATIIRADTLNEATEFNRELADDLALADRFGFVESSAGLFIPAHARPCISNHFADFIKNASENKSHLLSLSARGFEEFIANLFERLGYNVELTKRTRDGGVDLVCLNSMHGIPFKLAVEVKRYREDRPISAHLVRSFVGANQQFGADKLVFVTTSSYTAPAVSYADKYASQLLQLKDYEQIKEWCEQAQQQPWLLLSSRRPNV